MAILHSTIPDVALPFGSSCGALVKPMILIINPMIAKGMFTQFKDPKQGIKPTTIPTIERIPIIKPAICIGTYFLMV